MPVELTLLGLTLLLAFVQIMAAAHLRTRQYGTKWNTGARDEAMPPLDPLPGRLLRAQANLFETSHFSSAQSSPRRWPDGSATRPKSGPISTSWAASFICRFTPRGSLWCAQSYGASRLQDYCW